MTPPPLERFWSKVQKSDDCWLWLGDRSEGGYGRFWYRGRNVTAHRFAYEATSGPIPAGLYACHRCDVRACVNPSHLFLGTAQDNADDCRAKGRTANGERSGRYTMPERSARGDRINTAKLTWPFVIALRADASVGVRTGELSRRYGVSPSTVRRIVRGQYWNEAYAPRS